MTTARGPRLHARKSIEALRQLREAEGELRRAVSRCDRTLDVDAADARRHALQERCDALTRQARDLEAPVARTSVRDRVARRFERGFYATRVRTLCPHATPRMACTETAIDCAGVAVIGLGWCVPVAHVTSLEVVDRVLEYVRRHTTGYERAQLRPHAGMAVPASVGGAALCDALDPLQNLPTWQSMRLTLIACCLRNRARANDAMGAQELRREARRRGVHPKYLAPLEALRRSLAG